MIDIKKIKEIGSITGKINKNKEIYNLIVIGTKEGEGENNNIEGNIYYCATELTKKLELKEKIKPIGIYNCASEHRPFFYKYKWIFKEEEDRKNNSIFLSSDMETKFIKSNKDNGRVLVAFERSGKPIEVFDNVLLACKWLKDKGNPTDYRTILNIAKNHNKPKKNLSKTAAGYQWRFIEDVSMNE